MKRLIDLGFVWDPHEAQWMEMYQRLVDYKEEHNCTFVPKKYPQDPELGAVGRKIREQLMTMGKLSEKRIDLLNEIGFVWDPYDVRWNEMFERLVEYKKRMVLQRFHRYIRKILNLHHGCIDKGR